MEFRSFNKIARFSRDIIITEKIDGTNGLIAIGENGEFQVGSRNQWLTDENGNILKDNMGFAKWAVSNRDDLMSLGVGYHYGEWWGHGIQRGYGLKEKRFSLFNVGKWTSVFHVEDGRGGSEEEDGMPANGTQYAPECCYVVPVLYSGMMEQWRIEDCLETLAHYGSYAAPGYNKPEGIVIFHTASGQLFQKTILNDEKPKGGQ